MQVAAIAVVPSEPDLFLFDDVDLLCKDFIARSVPGDEPRDSEAFLGGVELCSGLVHVVLDVVVREDRGSVDEMVVLVASVV